VEVNPTSAEIHINSHGSDWLWAVTAVMMFSSVIFIVWSFLIPRRNRIFHYIIIAITLISSVSYFTMASDLGNAAVPVEFSRTNPTVSGATRSIFYARFIDWFLTNTVSPSMQSIFTLQTLTHAASSSSSLSCSRPLPHGPRSYTPGS
jgi:bacteriorhodopsin